MKEVKEILQGLKAVTSSSLTKLVLAAIEDAHMAIVNQRMAPPTGTNLHSEREAIAKRFEKNFGYNFDLLTDVPEKEVNVLDYASLSLVEEADLEAIIAMEGMISHARNCDIPQYIKFNTRLDSMLFGTRIDESNNPMDPEQIGEAFKEAIRPVGLPAKSLLIAYRHFNIQVFHNLEKVLEEANDYLISRGVLVDLDVAARDKKMLLNKRNKQRQKDDPRDRAFRSSEELAGQSGQHQDLFPLVQKLLHRLDATGGAGVQGNSMPAGESGASVLGGALQQGMMVGTKRVEVVSNTQLLSYLNELEARLNKVTGTIAGSDATASIDLRAPLGDLLQEKSGDKTVCAVDAQSSDVIQLVTLLFDAIWRDETVPIPIKELIGRTQITVLKVALKDATFFDAEAHPVRVLLNELATAGITWTQTDKLDNDLMYQKIKEIIKDLMANFAGDIDYVATLLEKFREFKAQQQIEASGGNANLRDAEERKNRLGEIEEYAQRKIDERVLDVNLHPDVRNFLNNYFHKFLVQVVLREGPGGISWRPVMNTIDVLLWTVQKERQKGDLERFVKVNKRLRTNLAKALSVARIEEEETERVLAALQVVQEQSFQTGGKTPSSSATTTSVAEPDASSNADQSNSDQMDLPEDDEHLQEVDQYPIGLWFEFQGAQDATIRCTLAAKIETIEKFVFVNSQGVKVIEKSRMGLARELKAGTVKVICDGPLIDRAIETVIAQLREAPIQEVA